MSTIAISEERWVQLITAETKLSQILHDHPELTEKKKLTPAAKRYKEAFKKFVDRTDQVLACPEIVAIFTVAAMHGCEYNGPTLAKDILDAKKLLK